MSLLEVNKIGKFITGQHNPFSLAIYYRQSSNRKTQMQFGLQAKRKGVLPRQLEGTKLYPVTDPITRARVDEQTADDPSVLHYRHL